ncbi:MAG TPA: 3-dehydroquinate synthase II [Nitrospinota bacterium]|nr:3-dehydroquinate synthase II [Nitrospinota bacterium]
MKKFYVDVTDYDKKIVTTAIESGADALLCNDTDVKKIKKLGLIKVISQKGDIRLGKDILVQEINNKEDEKKAMDKVKKVPMIAKISDWKIIPLEDLIASNPENVYCYVKNSKEAEIALNILEKGVAGVVLKTRNINELKKVSKVVFQTSEKINLIKAKIVEIKQLGLADRVCIDTTTNMGKGAGMLVGDTSSGYLLVHSESLQTPYCEPRPFRVNASAVHAYLKLPDNKTKYLTDLETGDELLIVNHDGTTYTTNLGRAKIEKRPMILIKAEYENSPISLIMQNAETIRLTKPGGKAVSVVNLKPGDEVLGYVEEAGRHFGQKIEESITEK